MFFQHLAFLNARWCPQTSSAQIQKFSYLAPKLIMPCSGNILHPKRWIKKSLYNIRETYIIQKFFEKMCSLYYRNIELDSTILMNTWRTFLSNFTIAFWCHLHGTNVHHGNPQGEGWGCKQARIWTHSCTKGTVFFFRDFWSSNPIWWFKPHNCENFMYTAAHKNGLQRHPIPYSEKIHKHAKLPKPRLDEYDTSPNPHLLFVQLESASNQRPQEKKSIC